MNALLVARFVLVTVIVIDFVLFFGPAVAAYAGVGVDAIEVVACGHGCTFRTVLPWGCLHGDACR